MNFALPAVQYLQRELLDPNFVEGAQQVINNKHDEFLGWVRRDLEKVEDAFHLLSSPEKSDQHAESFTLVTKTAERIRDRAGIFGYSTASEAAKSLTNYCHKFRSFEEAELIVIRKHLDSIVTVFRENMRGNVGMMGIQLLENLNKLIAKYHPDF